LPITGCPDHQITRSLPPPGYFGTFIANKGAYANPPLRHAWVALAWPLGGPRVAQASPKPNPRQAEGRKSLPVLANCQLPIADRSIFKDLSLSTP
jgi:hypothetical protein